MKHVDLLRQSFTGTSTATITLGGAVTGFRTVAQAIADSDLVIGDEVPMAVREGASWEISLFKVDSPTQLSRVRVLASWTGGAAVTFPNGSHEIFCTSPAEYLNGVTIGDLQAAASILDAFEMELHDPSSKISLKATVAALRAAFGSSAPPADTTAPTAPTNLASSSVTQTGFTITFTPGTDNMGVARSEWSLNGTTWTAIGNATSFNVTDRTAATTYTVRVRTVDTSGNVSAAATLNVTTAAASAGPDTQAPTWLAGSLGASNVTSTGYTMTWPTATDNVGVDHYESSIDGGATWTTHAANVTSRTVTGRTAGTTDQLRVRALDAAGNISNVLTATATTTAVVAYTIIGNTVSGNPNKPYATLSAATADTDYGTRKRWGTSKQSPSLYYTITPTPASVVAGWGDSPTVPPDVITSSQNTNGSSSLNGMLPMSHPSSWGNLANLYAAIGDRKYFWIKPVDGAPFCVDTNGTLITA